MSKKLKLSPWHDGSVKPVHVGVYERKSGFYNHWNGEYWSWGLMFVDIGEFKTNDKTPEQRVKWRGVLK